MSLNHGLANGQLSKWLNHCKSVTVDRFSLESTFLSNPTNVRFELIQRIQLVPDVKYEPITNHLVFEVKNIDWKELVHIRLKLLYQVAKLITDHPGRGTNKHAGEFFVCPAQLHFRGNIFGSNRNAVVHGPAICMPCTWYGNCCPATDYRIQAIIQRSNSQTATSFSPAINKAGVKALCRGSFAQTGHPKCLAC